MSQKIIYSTTCTRSRLQRGISLIESLVAIVVMALGILGILGVQMRTLADTQTGVRRAQAIRLIEDLSERVKSQPNGLGVMDAYVRDWDETGATETSPNCQEDACSPSELATYDLNRWIDNVRAALPLGDAAVFLATDNTTEDPRQLGVMISWRQNERDEKSAAIFQIDAKDSVTCPTDRICHLQYISPAQRCTPYENVAAKMICP